MSENPALPDSIFESVYLEGHVVDGEDVLVGGEAVGVLVLPQELVGRHRGGADGLERDLLARRPVLRQVDAREPALPDLLHHVVLRVQVHLNDGDELLVPSVSMVHEWGHIWTFVGFAKEVYQQNNAYLKIHSSSRGICRTKTYPEIML